MIETTGINGMEFASSVAFQGNVASCSEVHVASNCEIGV